MQKGDKKKSAKHYSNELLSSMDVTFTYWHTMHYFVGLIKSSEIKAGLILSFYGILLNFVYQNADEVKSSFDAFWWLNLLGITWVCLMLVSVFYSIRCFMPRIIKEYESNVFFFNDIISKFGGIKDYSKTFLDINIEKQQLFDQLGQQIYTNARITSAKFRNVNKSIRFLAFNLIVLLLLVSSLIAIKLFSA